MPSRLIHSLNSFDTCSQFSDSATLHTLTRIGAQQRKVYCSRSESDFNDPDTISYGNSSCCCDANIKTESDIDIESIPVPAPAAHRQTTSLSNYIGRRPPTVGNGFYRKSYVDNSHPLKSKQKATKSKFRLMNLLKFPKNKITSIDMSQFNSINTTMKKICGIGGGNSGNNSSISCNDSVYKKKSIIDERKLKSNRLQYAYPFHPHECKMCKGTHHLNAEAICNGGRATSAAGNAAKFGNPIDFDNGYMRGFNADAIAMHASDCELVLSRNSDPQQYQRDECFDNIDKNFKYCSLTSNKRAKNRPALLNSSYFHFDDGDFDFNDRDAGNRMETNLLSNGHLDTIRMPWKHRRCPSIVSSSSVAISTKWNPSKHWLAVTSILLIAGAAGVAVPLALRVSSGAPFDERLHAAYTLLESVPLIDGHNDLPYNIRKFVHNQLSDFDFDMNLKNVPPWSNSNWSHTDLHRLKKGHVSAQFWAAYVPCEAQHKDAVQITLEQIDVIIRLTEKYTTQLTLCSSSSEIVEAHKDHKICSLIGVEGGHSISGSLAVLRTLYQLGVRYMTLTSTCHTPWADSSYADAPKFDVKHGGLTEFGKKVIKEMNRLGMIVDLSHVSMATMRDSIATSEAPVIFSHSSAYELCNSSRNVQDIILRALAKNRGIVMVNFYSMFLSCSENASVFHAVAHLNHIRKVAGIDHVGIGAGYDGINYTPKGLEDVSKYPILFAELMGVGWTIEDLTKLASTNFLRVLKEVEEIRDKMKEANVEPYEDILPGRSDDSYNCTTS